jgi:hypothetical protein
MNDEAYEIFEDQLRRIGADLYPAEAHGLLCGLLSAAVPVNADGWIEQVLGETEPGDVLVEECRRTLRALHELTVDQFDNDSLEFSLLLPSDDATIGSRAEALGDWCQSYVFGLASCGVGADGTKLPGDAGEVLNDLVEISRAGLGEDDELEAEEEAYAELAEYVRVAVLLIAEELRGPTAASAAKH